MSDWPQLSVAADHETLAILHLAAQMLGKIRVAHAPWTNHGWHVALQPVERGLATLPTPGSRGRTFTLTLDLCRHVIVLSVSDGSREDVPLDAGSVAALHGRLVDVLDKHELPSTFNGRPSEIPNAVPFASCGVLRQGEPGAFLVGKLRSRGQPLLRPQSAAAPRRPSGLAGSNHARSLQP